MGQISHFLPCLRPKKEGACKESMWSWKWFFCHRDAAVAQRWDCVGSLKPGLSARLWMWRGPTQEEKERKNTCRDFCISEFNYFEYFTVAVCILRSHGLYLLEASVLQSAHLLQTKSALISVSTFSILLSYFGFLGLLCFQISRALTPKTWPASSVYLLSAERFI